MIIRIAKFGTGVKEVHLDTGCVKDALTVSGFSTDGLQIYLRGQIVDRDQTHFRMATSSF